MPPISPALLNALANPTIVAITDDTAAATAVNPVTFIPVTDPVTYASLCDSWGTLRANEVFAELQSAAANTNFSAQVQSDAKAAVITLTSTGFKMSSAKSVEAIAGLVALGLCTQDEANSATCTAVYEIGTAATPPAEVTATRAVLANYQALQTLQTQSMQFFGFAVNETIQPMVSQLLAGNAVTVPASIDAMLSAWRAAQ